jgi:hypothetical protein
VKPQMDLAFLEGDNVRCTDSEIRSNRVGELQLTVDQVNCILNISEVFSSKKTRCF